MAKTNLKTKETEASIEDFINAVEDENTREDCRKLSAIMEKATGEKPKMWSANLVGFGTYTYKYETGRTGDWFLTGFSPRKANLTVYFENIEKLDKDLLSKLGNIKRAKAV